MSTDDASLAELRADIDEIDAEIAQLVVERLELAEDVAAAKRGSGDDLVDAERETTVVDRYAQVLEDNGYEAERGEALAEFLIETALETERDVA